MVSGDSKGRGVSCNRDSNVEGKPAYRTAKSSRHRSSLKTKKNRVTQSAQGTNYNSKSGIISSMGDVGDSLDEEQQKLKKVLQSMLRLKKLPTAKCCGNDKWK